MLTNYFFAYWCLQKSSSGSIILSKGCLKLKKFEITWIVLVKSTVLQSNSYPVHSNKTQNKVKTSIFFLDLEFSHSLERVNWANPYFISELNDTIAVDKIAREIGNVMAKKRLVESPVGMRVNLNSTKDENMNENKN